MAKFDCEACGFSKAAPDEWVGRNAICPKCKKKSRVYSELESPPGEATLICECGFEAPPFYHTEHLYRCLRCKQIDNPRPVPFVFDTPNCSKCKTKFKRQDRVYTGVMPAYLSYKPVVDWSRVSTTPPELQLCPRCMHSKLGLNDLGIDFQISFSDDVAPVVGQIIHARMDVCKRPEIPYWLSVPRLDPHYSTSYQVLNFCDEKLGGGQHEFRVEELSKTEPRMTIKHVRELASNEWEWYYG